MGPHLDISFKVWGGHRFHLDDSGEVELHLILAQEEGR